MALNVEAAQVRIDAKVTGDQAIKKLGSDINSLHSGASGLQSAFANVGRVLGPLAAVAAAVSAGLFATKEALDYADSINDVKFAAGVTAEALQELRYVGVQLGLTTEQVDGLLVKFTTTLGKAKLKGDEANTAFKKLGLDPSKMKDTEKSFNMVIDQLRKIPDLATRNALAMEIFGRDAGPRLAQLIDKGSAGLNDLREAARKSGAVLSNEFIARAADSKDKLEAMTMVIKAQLTEALVELAPVLLSVAGAFAEMSRDIAQMVKGSKELLALGINVPEAGSRPRKVEGPTADELAGVRNLDFMKGRKAITVGGKTFGGKTPDVNLGGDDKDSKELDALLAKYDSTAEALAALTDAQDKLNVALANGEITADQHSRAMEGIGQAYSDLGAVEEDFTEETKATNEQLKLQAELQKHLDELYSQNIEVITGLSESTLEYQATVTDLNELHARGVITDEQRIAALERLDAAFDASANAYSAFADQAARNMQSIVAGFLSGQRAGDSFGKSIINMLRQIAAEMAAQAVLTSLFNMVGGFFGNPTLGTTTLGKRAMGGPVEGGRPYIVGERGPELVVPKNSGTVIPNSKLGGATITVTNNIDARGATNPAEIARALEASRQKTLADVRELAQRNRLGRF